MTSLASQPNGHSVRAHAPATPDREALATRAQRTRLAGRVSLVAPLLGAAAGAWLLLRGERTRATGLRVLGASLGLGVLRWQLQRFVTETVSYQLKATIGDIEFRSYPAQVWAETVVDNATWEEALSEGFERLAGYIFGGNQGSERLSMTAPVLSSLPAEPSEGKRRRGKQRPLPAALVETGGDASAVLARTVAFVMPGDRELRNLPAPEDRRVRLRAVPARHVAVLGFSGDYRGNLPEEKRVELLMRLHEAGITPKGAIRFAGYDPPTTLPALRRNEVIAELDEGVAP